MVDEGLRVQKTGGDFAAESCRAFFRAYRAGIWLVGLDMGLPPWPELREQAAYEFSGWVASRLSLWRNKRLRAALGDGSPHDLNRTLLERLPAAVWEAWYDLDPNEDPHVVRTHAANILAGGGQRRRKRRPPSALDGPMRYDPTPMSSILLHARLDFDVVDEVHRRYDDGRSLAEALAAAEGRQKSAGEASRVAAAEQFAARESVLRCAAIDDFEMAEMVHRLTHDFQLSERQAQVAYLRGQRWKHSEIAEYLGIDVDTSKQHSYRARLKVKAAV
jgi:DNA-directed RNA polymerase specialized sigma24 family protein